MPSWKLYHNPQCSKSREALAFLETQNFDVQVIEYIKSPLSKEELLELLQQLEVSPSSLVRTKEPDFINIKALLKSEN